MKTVTHYALGCVTLVMILAAQGCKSSIDAVKLNREAQVYMKHGYYDKAKDLLVKSFEYDYENAASHYWLGQCYEQLGEIDNAHWEYEIAIRFNPTYDLAQMAFITSLYNHQKIEYSIEAAALYLKHKDGPARDFVQIARSFMKLGMEPHAVLAYDAAANAEPRNPHPYLELADFYLAQRNKDKETEYLTRAFKADPFFPGLGRRLGELGIKVHVPQPEPAWEDPTPLEAELSKIGT